MARACGVGRVVAAAGGALMAEEPSSDNQPVAELDEFLQVLSDHPLDGAADDPISGNAAFNFEEISETLAGIAWNRLNQTPLSVVIEAEWGRGKTTLMLQIKRQMREREEGRESRPKAKPDPAREVKTLWFNAWKYPSEDLVLAGLLGALMDKFRKGNLGAQLTLFVHEHKGTLAHMVLSMAASRLPGAKALKAGNRYGAVSEKRAFYDFFVELFAQLQLLLFDPMLAPRDLANIDLQKKLQCKQKSQVLVIFLDDLDRCSDERVMEVLRAIYLLQDMPGVCFYLGLDWGRLCKVLKKSMDDDEEAAGKFLEKIVQIKYEIPDVDEESAGAYIDTLVGQSGLKPFKDDEDAEDEDDKLVLLSKSLDTRHPRHLKRFLNDLAINISVLAKLKKATNSERGNVPDATVLAMHALRWIGKVKVRTEKELDDLRSDLHSAQAGRPPESLSKEAVQLVDQQKWILQAINKLEPAQIRDILMGAAKQGPAQVEEVGRFEGGFAEGGGRLRVVAPEIDWVDIPSGEFTIGDQDIADAKPRTVSLSKFEIARFPVTNEQYARYVTGGEVEPPKHWQGRKPPPELLDHPVVNVSWEDAGKFCEWLTVQAGREGSASLLSEAQWEFAARGLPNEKGLSRTYPWGEAEPSEERANFDEGIGGTTPVNRYRRGSTPDHGLYDMAGNVWEWCRDSYKEGAYAEWDGSPPEDPVTDAEGRYMRALRGGSWYDPSVFLRAAYRRFGRPGLRGGGVGFRVAWLSS